MPASSRRQPHQLVLNSHARRGVPEVGSRVARPALLRHEHQTRAQDSPKNANRDGSRRISRKRWSSTRALFKKIYEEEYGGRRCAVQPPRRRLRFGRHPQDIAFLEKMSNVAAAAHTPFISAASPKLFDMDSFTQLATPRDLAKGFGSAELVKWRSFRDSEDSRYVSLALPHILMRLPYGPDTKPTEGVNFVESVNGTDHSKYLWGNAAYALGQRITAAFAQHSWCAAIRGVEGGGLVKNCRRTPSRRARRHRARARPRSRSPTAAKELNDPSSRATTRSTDTRVLRGATTNKPKQYTTNDANANARISGMLPYVLAASRFAHYLKVIMRDKIGSFMTRGNVEQTLNNWIAQYVLLNDDAPQAVKANYPLREARVDVTDIPGKPGAYNATVFLKPHFQLEELSASIRLVAELPPPAA